ncbi:MAG: Stp1/IreP family PP2C-type Ser/Thr phosphatase [Oscillospiraceae bacterium]|nr:Stp1/IreP family PP2C-type Ser/Thr phosphatase [Oscillospiraceae bacterium]
MELWGITDNGRVRQHNQDVFYTHVDEERDTAIFVVCDGMGGANAGNIASTLAAETFMEYMQRQISDFTNQTDVVNKMTDAVLAANSKVFDKSNLSLEYSGMGTTLTAAVSTKFGEVVANVGDSRLYHITKSEVRQITKDHSVVEEMIERGEITRDEAHTHPNKNFITRAIGTSVHEPPDIFFVDLKPGEFLLLCSDGFSNLATHKDILTQLNKGKSVKKSCEFFVTLALSRGAPDNVTVVVCKK